MADQLLQELSLDDYQGLLDTVFPPGTSVCVTDVGGELLWSSSAQQAEDIAQIVRRLAGGGQWADAAPGQTTHDATADATNHAAALGVEGDQTSGVLLVIIPSSQTKLDRSAQRNAVAAVANRICQELTLNVELEQMAGELTERYEELNLVYHTEDHVTYFVEGQEALKRLLGNCCEYLNVAFAALVMQDKGVSTMAQNSREPLEEPDQCLERLKEGVYDKVVANAQPLAINNLEGPEASALWQGLPYKLLACPIVDSKGRVAGIIAIANPADALDFSNSDKNLLTVMARKAAKIVQVNFDQLTGLMSREGFEYFIDQSLEDARLRNSTHCLLYFNIDQLHVVNDTISHAAGDLVIQELSGHLRSRVRDADLLGRIGGDEMGLLLRNCSLKKAAVIADKLRDEIAQLEIPWNDRKLKLTVSVGVAPVKADSVDTAAILTAAELTCQSAKEHGKNRVELFQADDTRIAQRHEEMYLVGTIQDALREDRFTLFGQLIEPLAPGHGGWHLELLLRMLSEHGRPVLPVAFMSAAERYHLMPALDRWVLNRALDTLADDQLAEQISLCTINVSGQSFGDGDYLEFVIDKLSSTNIPLNKICFEITETAAIANLEKATRFMFALKREGCRFALDDFGSGLSSFGYLRTLPVDYLKIDGAIVKEIAVDEVAESMVAAIHQIADVMGLETIAEFVENDAIKDKLRDIGVDFGQGFGIAKPRPLDELLAELQAPQRAAG